jgi:hypothetical protein
MGQVNNLNDPNFQQKVLDRLDKLERATPMNNAAIGRDGFEVYDGGVITISNGGLKVTGSIDVIGELIASGTLTFSGTLTQEGESTFTGPTHLDGPTDTTGTLDVEGVTTLKNDLNVTAGGKIIAGSVTVDPSYLSGSVKFSNGTYIAATPNGAQLVKGSGGAVTVSSSQADIGIPGGGSVIADGSGVVLNGLLTKSGVTANLYIDPATKRLYQVV